MSTSQQTPGLSEPSGAIKISKGTLGYIRARARQRAYDLVIGEFKKSGITQADLARRLDKQPEVISRLLARPGNWESDTFSDMLFAISGAIASYGVYYPLAKSSLEVPPAQAKPQVQATPTKVEARLETQLDEAMIEASRDQANAEIQFMKAA